MAAFTPGVGVYPSVTDAPDWHWEKVLIPGGGHEWVEYNRPEPLYYEIHQNTDDTENMLNPDDYPPSLHKSVRAVNELYKRSFINSLSRGTLKAGKLAEVIGNASNGQDDIDLWKASDGWTKTVSFGYRGFVAHG